MKDKIGQETLEIMSTVKWYNQWLFKIISAYLKGTILEVGAGIGNFTPLLHTRGKVYAIDINKNYLTNLRKELPDSIKVGYGDIEKDRLDFKKEKFNAIVCMNVLEHIKDDVSALGNMNTRLLPNGKLVLLVPAFMFAYGKLDEKLGHVRRYSFSDLNNKLKNNGFEIEDWRYLNFLGIFGWFVNSKILNRKIIPRTQLKVFSVIARPFVFIENFFKPPIGLSLLFIAKKV